MPFHSGVGCPRGRRPPQHPTWTRELGDSTIGILLSKSGPVSQVSGDYMNYGSTMNIYMLHIVRGETNISLLGQMRGD